MSTFVKFPSITNHYQALFIQKMLEFHPGLENERFVVTEKLHGANLQIYFELGKALYRVGSRNRFLETNSKFYNVWNALTRVEEVLASAKCWTDWSMKTLRLFGELHGGNVQAGINYGPEQNIRFFAAMIDDCLISPEELLGMRIRGLRQNFAPILSTSETLESALALNIDRDSVLTPAGHEGPNLIEGVVIQPYSNVYRLPCGTSFVLKKKNDQFLVSQKKPRSRTPMESAIVELRVSFLDYITEARVDSIISQAGPFTDITQLGAYIVATLNDAKADFTGEYDEALQPLDKKTLKYIFNVGGLIANMLKARL